MFTIRKNIRREAVITFSTDRNAADRETLRTAHLFGHLLSANEALNGLQFADRIRQHYAATDPRTSALIRALILAELPELTSDR